MITIEHVEDVGDDVLLVTATDEDGTEWTATGWVSATTHCYDPHDYGEDGHLVAGAVARAMTPAEVGEYALQRLLEQNPQLTPPTPPPAPTPIAFEAPA